MTSDLEIALTSLRQKYDVHGTFRYSDFFQLDGEKILHDWIEKKRLDYFEPNQRIVFLQDCDDVYDYGPDIGKCTMAIQQAMKIVDISNCFGLIVTSNYDIEKELSLANEISVNSPDIIGYHLVPGNYQKSEKVYGDTFCSLPWTHLYIAPDGDILPCCTGNTDFPIGNIHQQKLSEIYNNDRFQSLRRRMLQGLRTKECASCWYKEDSGLSSIRQKHKNRSAIEHLLLADGSVETMSPTTMDIRLNKLCNLKCRSCSPKLSSAIAQEIEEIYNHRWPMLTNKERKEALREILDLLPNVTSIYFAGGEPLLAPEHFAMLSELIKINKTDVVLFYNTNFMQLSFKENDFIDLWAKFNDVTLGASLDAIGPVAEYLRHGTKWDTIEKNLAYLKSRNFSNIKFKITSTLGMLNVESLIELQKDWTERGLVSIEDFEIQEFIFDSYLSLQVLPEKHKRRMDSIITQHISWLLNLGAKELADRWQGAIDYMWFEDRSHLLAEFRRITMTTDRHRNESFHATFPHLRDLIPLNDSIKSSIITQ